MQHQHDSIQHDTAFQMSASNIRFGAECTREVGLDLLELKVRRTLVVIDPALRALPVGETVTDSLRSAGVEFDVFDRVRVEPTDAAFREATEAAVSGRFDSFVAVGGGSTIDTAKAAKLYSTYPAEFLEYVNAPIGRGQPVPGASRQQRRQRKQTPTGTGFKPRCRAHSVIFVASCSFNSRSCNASHQVRKVFFGNT
jgi:hydroxyacid-oxoacid transhydrogenase